MRRLGNVLHLHWVLYESKETVYPLSRKSSGGSGAFALADI